MHIQFNRTRRDPWRGPCGQRVPEGHRAKIVAASSRPWPIVFRPLILTLGVSLLLSLAQASRGSQAQAETRTEFGAASPAQSSAARASGVHFQIEAIEAGSQLVFGSAGIPVNRNAPSRTQDKPIISNNLALRTNPAGGANDCRSGKGPSEGKLSSSFDRAAASREGSPLAGDTADRASTRSAPPDTTPYVRPIVPEDYAPGGRPAIPSNIYVPGRDQRLRDQRLRDQRLRKQTPDRSNNGDS